MLDRYVTVSARSTLKPTPAEMTWALTLTVAENEFRTVRAMSIAIVTGPLPWTIVTNGRSVRGDSCVLRTWMQSHRQSAVVATGPVARVLRTGVSNPCRCSSARLMNVTISPAGLVLAGAASADVTGTTLSAAAGRRWGGGAAAAAAGGRLLERRVTTDRRRVHRSPWRLSATYLPIHPELRLTARVQRPRSTPARWPIEDAGGVAAHVRPQDPVAGPGRVRCRQGDVDLASAGRVRGAQRVFEQSRELASGVGGTNDE